MKKIVIEEQLDGRVIMAVVHAGRRWEIDVRVDFDDDGGISADIARDGVICTSADFAWTDKHENE